MDGYHGSMPTNLFMSLLHDCKISLSELHVEVNRWNNRRNAGLYIDNEHIMGLTMQEFPEFTLRKSNGGIEALGWRDAFDRLIREYCIEPSEELKTYMGTWGISRALGGRKSRGPVASVRS